jgi:hypothetical protein
LARNDSGPLSAERQHDYADVANLMSDVVAPWEPLGCIHWPCGSVDVADNDDGLTLLVRFSDVIGGGDRDLLLRFGRVLAFSSHEEFAHPWVDDPIVLPRLGGTWSQWVWPLLEVTHSTWLATFSPARRASYDQPRHYRVISMDNTIDVLTANAVQAEWVIHNTHPDGHPQSQATSETKGRRD